MMKIYKFKALLLFCLILMIFTFISSVHSQDANNTSQIITTDDSFDNLEKIINNSDENSTVILNKNYASVGDEITVKKSLTIDGGGHSLNGTNASRIFYIQTDNVVIKNINFINGYSENNGGAVFLSIDSDDCNFINCTFSHNFAQDEGGAVYGSFSSNVTFINCIFKNNHAVNGGSFSWFLGSHCILKNCTFSDNTADYGGAVFFNAFDGAIINSSFNNNTADIYGGSVFWNGYNGKVSGSIFSNNTAPVGGSLYWFEEGGCVTNCSFINNSAENGGSVCWDGFKGTLSECSFLNNHADEGGAIFWTGEKGTLTKSDFTNNSAKTNAGAVWWDEEAVGGLILNCTFSNNTPCDVSDFSSKLSTIIIASNLKTTYGKGKLVVKLTDFRGAILKGKIVEISLKGKSYNLKTDSNGKAYLSLNTLFRGTYTVYCLFEGNDNYRSSSKTLVLTVKKATPKLSVRAKTFKKSVKIKKYKVTLKTNLNKAMKNVKLTIKISKKTYTAKTNKNGVATFKITKLNKKGKFKSKVTYKGSGNYNKIVKKVTIQCI